MNTIFRSLETMSNRLDGELSVGIPLVPKYMCTGEGGTLTSQQISSSRTDVVLSSEPWTVLD